MYTCEKISTELDITRVSVGRYNTPWIIANNGNDINVGNVYYAECDLNKYWDEVNLQCVASCPTGKISK